MPERGERIGLAKSFKDQLSNNYTLGIRKFIFSNTSIKITPFSKILKLTQTIWQLTTIDLPDPAQFDQVIWEIHEEEKGKQAQEASTRETKPASYIEHFEEEEEESGDDEPEWLLDMVETQTLRPKKIKILSTLPNLSGVLVSELGTYYPSNPPNNCIILPASAFCSGLLVPFPQELSFCTISTLPPANSIRTPSEL